jgi:DNA-binding protein H-NS
MPTLNLKGMDVDALLSLRANIDKRLGEKRTELEQQLTRLSTENNGADVVGNGRRTWRGSRRRGPSAMKGRKVPPKYRGPAGETWAGRGARPRWLAALLKQGRKLEEFAINKTAAARRKLAAKKSRRKRK